MGVGEYGGVEGMEVEAQYGVLRSWVVEGLVCSVFGEGDSSEIRNDGRYIFELGPIGDSGGKFLVSRLSFEGCSTG